MTRGLWLIMLLAQIPALLAVDYPLFPYYSVPLLWDSHSFHRLGELNLSYSIGKLEGLRNWRSWQEYEASFCQQTILLDLCNIFPWNSTACPSTLHQFWNFTNCMWKLDDIFFPRALSKQWTVKTSSLLQFLLKFSVESFLIPLFNKKNRFDDP